MGNANGRRPGRGGATARDLRISHGLLYRWTHGRGDKRLSSAEQGLGSVMAEVALRNVFKSYDDVVAVSNISLDIPNHEFVVLVGPSGCGKSTTLRMIAGLEEIGAGEIVIDGEVVNDLPPKDRDIAMVFQNYALYPHMTVAENMSFGLKLRKFPKAEIRQRGDNAARISRHHGTSCRPPQAPFRWPAPACRHGPCHRAKSQGISVRRAAV